MSAREQQARTDEGLAMATFAGGCFWCMEPPFDGLDGVVATTAGYTGGHTTNPTYEDVCSGRTEHAEAVRITYDPRRISYAKLLETFWHNVDPTDAGGQFCDRGSQYRTAIFYHDETQKRLAEESKRALEQSGRIRQPIMTQIVAASEFYPAEDYHQDFCRRNPFRYEVYRLGSGRSQRLDELWRRGSSGEEGL